MFSQASLRTMLTVPYVILVLLAALIIGLLSYRAGSQAVDTLSDAVLNETVNRITQAVDKHISGSEAVLETAFPSDVAAPTSVEGSLEELRMRLWLATSIHRDPNNYAYYGNRKGQFIGLWRFSETEAELRLRTDGTSPRSIYRFSRILGDLDNPVLETQIFDPRERPWFKVGQGTDTQSWTSIYIDFKTQELVSTRARRINNAAGDFEGVVATDMSLQHLNDFLKTLELSENAVAFIVEPDGNILATSQGAHRSKVINNDNSRLNVASSDNQLMVKTYNSLNELEESAAREVGTNTTKFHSDDGAIIQAGYRHLKDAAGLDWLVAVAVPRQDFMHKVTANVYRTAIMALIFCALIIALGLIILNRVAAQLHQLVSAAQAMGQGELGAPLPVHRKDEIGELARTFSSLQKNLLTDPLTGIANRKAIERKLEDRVIKQRRRNDKNPFALLFVDLDDFKLINDKFGHVVGDGVLSEVARRLSKDLRDVDTPARFGGDEFIVLLDNVTQQSEVEAVCQKLQTRLRQPYTQVPVQPDRQQLYSQHASIGFAIFPADGQDLETLLKKADERMYTQKHSSKQSNEYPKAGKMPAEVEP